MTKAMTKKQFLAYIADKADTVYEAVAPGGVINVLDVLEVLVDFEKNVDADAVIQ
jgi:hypothetical protein